MSYTRWGKTSCPTTQGTELVYEGAVVGSHHSQAGSSQYLCLHNEPQFLQTTPGLTLHHGRLYGTEYEPIGNAPAFTDMLYHEVPCSVCYSFGRSTTITIPGRTECPPSWTREYYGYLMSESYHSHHKSRAPVCVDVDAESIPGSSEANIRSILYFLETTCTGINCPPYSEGAEITCAVCTK